MCSYYQIFTWMLAYLMDPSHCFNGRAESLSLPCAVSSSCLQLAKGKRWTKDKDFWQYKILMSLHLSSEIPCCARIFLCSNLMVFDFSHVVVQELCSYSFLLKTHFHS